MNITREKITGIIGTVLFSVLFLLILIFSYLRTPIPPQGLEGIPVMFGSMDDAGGNEEPPMQESQKVNETTPPPPTPKVEQPLITQNTQPSVHVKPEKKEEKTKPQQPDDTKRRQAEAAEKKRQEEAQRINQQMSGLFGQNNAGSRGNTQGAGTQGVSTGNSPKGSPTGSGGIGSYDLGGRSVGAGGLAQPRYAVNDYGTVVVTITVDPGGNVIHAEIGRGTNTPSPSLRNEALRAARNTKFNAISSANNQKGTITYRFNLN